MNEENQNFTDYVSQIDETQLATDYASKLSNNEVLYDSDYDNPTFDSNLTNPIIDTTLDSEPTESAIYPTCGPEPAAYSTESAAVCDLNSCDLDDGELTCGDDFADNGETIQGGPCQDLIEYFSDKPYLD